MPAQPTIVLLAAGKNSRFFPLNTTTHKAGISLLGKPLILRTLENLQAHDFKKVVIVISPKDNEPGGLADILSQASLELDLKVVLQPEPKGMGDALLKAREFIEGSFIVAHPYYLTAGSIIQQMLGKNQNLICVTETNTPWEYGIVQLENDKAVGIVEKPEKGSEPTNLKNVVLHLLGETFLQILEKTPISEYSYEAALNQLMKQQPVGVHHLVPAPISLKYPWELLSLQADLLIKQKSNISSQASIASTAIIDQTQGPVVIEPGAKVGHAARVVGPAYIGRNSVVGDFSLVRESNLEEQVLVGAYTEIARSNIQPKSSIHNSYLADSIVGKQVKIGAGFITANKRHDRKPIATLVKGNNIDTGLINLGTVIGDLTAIGVRVTTMPGVFIGSQTTIYPGLTLFDQTDHQQIRKQ